MRMSSWTGVPKIWTKAVSPIDGRIQDPERGDEQYVQPTYSTLLSY